MRSKGSKPGPVRNILRIALPLALILLAFGLVEGERRLAAFSASPCPLAATPSYDPVLVERCPLAVFDAAAVGAREVPLEHRFARGETLGSVLQELGLEPADAWSATTALAEHVDVRRVRAGQRLAVYTGEDSRPVSLRLDLDGEGRVVAEREGDGWRSSWQPFQRAVRVSSLTAELDSSLEGAIRAAGGDPRLSLRMAEVLQWDLDFHRDLRTGDRFELLFENVYLDGRYYAPGRILALSYENGGKRLEAYRFGDDENGYYDAEGRPLQKMFLRSPLRYSRVTSRFTTRRFHPVLKSYRPHYGVDYGAPVGTPVRVTAGGVVSFAGWSKGGGKMVKVNHPNGYLTAYLHLSRFAQGVSPGRRVSQGEVIAYSGNTGLSTGPHLDYRVQRNGRWIDPLSLKSVPADPIPEAQLAVFREWRDACRDSLATGAPPPQWREEGIQLAVSRDDPPEVPVASVAGR